MAILMDDQFIKCCKCGSETFKEEELFRIKADGSKKDSLGTATVCANCNEVLKIKAR